MATALISQNSDLGKKMQNIFDYELLPSIEAGQDFRIKIYPSEEAYEKDEFYIYGVCIEEVHVDADIEQDVWSFVEHYYPNYSSCNEILHNDILTRLVDGELEIDEQDEWTQEDMDNNNVHLAKARSDVDILEKSILNFLSNKQSS